MSCSGAARLGGLAVVLMLVAGCRGTDDGTPAPVAQTSPAESPPAQQIPAQQIPAQQIPPSPEARPFFVGRWAATEDFCDKLAWRFTADGLSTPGEVTCAFDQVTKTPRGYDIVATCWAGGPPETERMTLSYAQSARALLVEGGPFNPVGLVACDGQRP